MSYVSRIEKTIIFGVFWIVFVLIAIAFNPLNFGFWQNIGALFVSGIIAGGILALTWVKGCFY